MLSSKPAEVRIVVQGWLASLRGGIRGKSALRENDNEGDDATEIGVWLHAESDFLLREFALRLNSYMYNITFISHRKSRRDRYWMPHIQRCRSGGLPYALLILEGTRDGYPCRRDSKSSYARILPFYRCFAKLLSAPRIPVASQTKTLQDNLAHKLHVPTRGGPMAKNFNGLPMWLI